MEMSHIIIKADPPATFGLRDAVDLGVDKLRRGVPFCILLLLLEYPAPAG